MQRILIISILIHVLADLLWAGPNSAIARKGGLRAERLFLRMRASILTTILSAWNLWKSLHGGFFGPTEQSVGLGIAAAIIALAIKSGLLASALLALRGVTHIPACRRSLVARHMVAVLPPPPLGWHGRDTAERDALHAAERSSDR